MAGVIKAIEVERLSTDYSVRKLTEADIPAILNLYRGNPDYFVHCPPAASTESVCEDMTALTKIGKRTANAKAMSNVRLTSKLFVYGKERENAVRFGSLPSIIDIEPDAMDWR